MVGTARATSVEQRFCYSELSERRGSPLVWIQGQLQPSLFRQDHTFPNANRGKPFSDRRVLQRFRDAVRNSLRLKETPNPNVRIEEEPLERRTSRSFHYSPGKTMSPAVRPVPARAPLTEFTCPGEVQ